MIASLLVAWLAFNLGHTTIGMLAFFWASWLFLWRLFVFVCRVCDEMEK